MERQEGGRRGRCTVRERRNGKGGIAHAVGLFISGSGLLHSSTQGRMTKDDIQSFVCYVHGYGVRGASRGAWDALFAQCCAGGGLHAGEVAEMLAREVLGGDTNSERVARVLYGAREAHPGIAERVLARHDEWVLSNNAGVERRARRCAKRWAVFPCARGVFVWRCVDEHGRSLAEEREYASAALGESVKRIAAKVADDVAAQWIRDKRALLTTDGAKAGPLASAAAQVHLDARLAAGMHLTQTMVRALAG